MRNLLYCHSDLGSLCIGCKLTASRKVTPRTGFAREYECLHHPRWFRELDVGHRGDGDWTCSIGPVTKIICPEAPDASGAMVDQSIVQLPSASLPGQEFAKVRVCTDAVKYAVVRCQPLRGEEFSNKRLTATAYLRS